MKTTTRPLGRRLAAIRHDFRGDREARAARRALERELSSYTSPSELNDLDAILDRHSDEETADIRRFLASRRVS
jgi:predicted deacylase